MCEKCKAIACIIDKRGIKMKAKRKKNVQTIKKEELSFEDLQKKIMFDVNGRLEDIQFNRHNNIMQIVEALRDDFSEIDIRRLAETYFSEKLVDDYLRIAHNYLGDKPIKNAQIKLFDTSKIKVHHAK
jgi:hypothetical protein